MGISTPVWGLFRIHTDVDWMKRVGVRGIVIGRNILFSEPGPEIPTWLLRHELEHAYQQIREGRFLFYLKYFVSSLRHGYKNNPFEVEARDRQSQPLTTSEEQLLWRLKEGSPKSRIA